MTEQLLNCLRTCCVLVLMALYSLSPSLPSCLFSSLFMLSLHLVHPFFLLSICSPLSLPLPHPSISLSCSPFISDVLVTTDTHTAVVNVTYATKEEAKEWVLYSHIRQITKTRSSHLCYGPSVSFHIHPSIYLSISGFVQQSVAFLVSTAAALLRSQVAQSVAQAN